MTRIRSFIWVLGVASLFIPQALARPVQIIHTNDLHSTFEGQHSSDGGYAAVKAVIDKVKTEAAARGIESLVLDAGDFLEGSPFYLAGTGHASLDLLNNMGYDAVTIGNHDWLMGTWQLDALLGFSKPNFPILAANFYSDSRYKNLEKHMMPWAEFTKNGIKIAVLGLTTDSILYSWRVDDGYLEKPVLEAEMDVPALRENNDFVFVLSHLGLSKDISLAKKIPGIDLIVGGHSHNSLTIPTWSANKKGYVPIVQAGAEAKSVGSLLVDLEPNQPLKILDYKLIPITSETPRDPLVEQLVAQKREQLEFEYGKDWLNEVIGVSEIPLTRQRDNPTVWSMLVVDAMRDAAKADTALDISDFSGTDQPAGPLNREKLITLYPRVFDLSAGPGKVFGWTVWSGSIRGWLLKFTLKKLLEAGYSFSLSGVTYKIKIVNGKRKISDIRIKGKRISNMKNYRVALPEGIGKATKETEVSGLLKLVIKKSKDTKITVWSAIENRIKNLGGVIKEL